MNLSLRRRKAATAVLMVFILNLIAAPDALALFNRKKMAECNFGLSNSINLDEIDAPITKLSADLLQEARDLDDATKIITAIGNLQLKLQNTPEDSPESLAGRTTLLEVLASLSGIAQLPDKPFEVRLFHNPTTHGTVVLLGELHVKSSTYSELGKKILANYPFRTLELRKERLASYLDGTSTETEFFTKNPGNSTILDGLNELGPNKKNPNVIAIDVAHIPSVAGVNKDLKKSLVVNVTFALATGSVALLNMTTHSYFSAHALIGTIVGLFVLLPWNYSAIKRMYADLDKLKVAKTQGKTEWSTTKEGIAARDLEMSRQLAKISANSSNPREVLAVVGSAHVPGMTQNLQKEGFYVVNF